ncbi:MAG: YihY/virulence factor BrkB family protein [Anaerolineae bacterium]|nr:YihY/virulence factor BrkB family protein [Anaerolineae bacterium]
MKRLDPLRHRLRPLYHRADARSQGILGILRSAIQRYGEGQASQAAAGLAYYIFFSLFPLLLILVTVATYVLELNSDEAFSQAVGFITQAIPVSHDLIANNLKTVLDLRGAVGLVSLVGTLWSASSAFTILDHNINLAWPNNHSRGYVHKRLVAFGIVGVLVLLLLLSLASSAIASIIPRLFLPDPRLQVLESFVWSVLFSRVVPLLFSALLFVALYRWVPTAKVSWRAGLWGGSIAATAWEAAKAGVTWFLSSGLTNYLLVYGSLASVVVLLLWIYISASITLFGAHLTAAIDRRPIRQKATDTNAI